MDVIATSIEGLWKIVTAPVHDERGWFVRTLDTAAFARFGFVTAWPEGGEAHNLRAGTLRGLHLQHPPHAEAKVIRCVRGAVFDVLVDARAGSATYGRWEAFDLRDDDDVMLYAAPGLAHGYQTLRDDTTMAYLHSTPYAPHAASGVRYDSPALAIPWPLAVSAISARDRALPAFGVSGIDA